ncbi:restriction endonuclease subunit S [Glaesserella parasuis]|uniref:restriction endonuclease subunit S n=1 Tax=Glaesserella parasuis TaxID=738 RepID=UPI002EAB7C6C|nr:restriction endonuclease subunit S [Glaesserella parasuis]
MSKLGDFVRVQGGYAFKSSELSDDKTGVPVIKIGNITGGSFVDLSNYQSVSFQLFEKTKSFATKDNDILIAMTGANVGKTSRVPVNSDAYLINQRVGRFLLKEDCPYTSDFIYYVVSSKQAYQYFSRVADGAAQPNISGKTIEDLEFPNIDSRFANKIGNILKSLDDKIQLNTQINQTLEQIAQTIFKSWFIDFDPVHAKANALASGQTAEQATQAAMAVISGKNTQELHRLQTANLEQYQQLWEIAEAFPSGFDEEGVPRGWEERYLKDVCNIVYGKGLPKNKLTEKGFYVFGANGVIGFYDSYTYEKPQVLIGCRGTVGQVTLSYPYSFVTNNSLVIEYENSCVSMYYLEKYLSNINLKEISSGSVQPQITIQNMSKVKILIPNIEILNFYSEKVKEIYDKRLHHFYENQSLSKVRDLLLPKLLSGEV